MPTVLLTGATGFVGSAAREKLQRREGVKLRCATRHVAQARRKSPSIDWVHLDVSRASGLVHALEGVDTAVYLIHSMGRHGGGGDFAQAEAESATRFALAAAEAGVKRIVYLGGVAPAGQPSKHLASRLRTGECLRAGKVPVVELRAGMIVGSGSESWQIVRDLSMRLPVMVLPAWLEHRSEPVAIADVVEALVYAATAEDVAPGVYGLPGPEALSGGTMLERTAALRGLVALSVKVPFITPRLSSYWIGLVTRADLGIARELVEGLTSDLVSREPSFWPVMGGHRPLPFDDAARAAFKEEAKHLSLRSAALEWMIQHIAPWKKAG
ncbi:MAG: NAD(P)H-binding protein [Archangiaceae bacterium]|nr:NAD(P)H-binding protein [Archangiaceae bacterium]